MSKNLLVDSQGQSYNINCFDHKNICNQHYINVIDYPLFNNCHYVQDFVHFTLNCRTPTLITLSDNSIITVSDDPTTLLLQQLPISYNNRTFSVNDISIHLHSNVTESLLSHDHNLTSHIIQLIDQHSPKLELQQPSIRSDLQKFFQPERITGSHIIAIFLLCTACVFFLCCLICMCKFSTFRSGLLNIILCKWIWESFCNRRGNRNNQQQQQNPNQQQAPAVAYHPNSQPDQQVQILASQDTTHEQQQVKQHQQQQQQHQKKPAPGHNLTRNLTQAQAGFTTTVYADN